MDPAATPDPATDTSADAPTEQAATLASTARAPGSRRGGPRSPADMLRSMLVVVALVGALFLIVPRTSEVRQPPVDVAVASGAVPDDAGFTPLVPQDLPEGWRATSARFGPSTDQVPTWHVGWVIEREGQQSYVELEQAAEVTEDWLLEQSTGDTDGPTSQLGGVTWTQRFAGEEPVGLRTRDGDVDVVLVGDDPALVAELAATLDL